MNAAAKIVVACVMIATLATVEHSDAFPRQAQALPDIEAPPLGETQWIAERMRMNGLPMTVKTFRSKLHVEDVFRHYETWAHVHGMKETRRSRRDEWQVLALKSIHHFISIQARHGVGGTEGTITVSSSLDAAPPNLATRFPHPVSTHIVNLQQYDDSGIESEHISLLSSRSVTLEARAFARVLSEQGWQLVRDLPASKLIRGHVIEAQRGAEHAMVTLQPDHASSATAIVIVWKKS